MAEPIFALEHISFTYPGGRQVFRDMDFALYPDRKIGLYGPNGSGKTTITRLLTGLEKPTKGRVLYEGKDITKEEASERSRFIGYVFQQPDRQMFMPTVREEIALGPYHQGKRGEELNRMVEKAMMETDTTALAEAYPRTLSRGDQQRVAIARALAMKPDILCFDEPTSALDPELTGEVLRVLRDLADRKTTMIIVTHEMHFARDVADRILFMDGGVVVEEGPARQLIDHPQEERTKQFLAHYSE